MIDRADRTQCHPKFHENLYYSYSNDPCESVALLGSYSLSYYPQVSPILHANFTQYETLHLLAKRTTLNLPQR